MHPVATWRGPALRAIAIALFGLVGAAGCTMVGESLTGVSLEKREIQNCIVSCNDLAHAAMRAEQSTHQENVDACLQLSGSDKEECLSDEGARHSAAVQQIAADRRECQGSCHHQGRGSAG
jgi:hypothetical protein